MRTRAGWTWVGACIAAVIAILLIIFIVQNSQRVQVSFLWLDGRAPLAVTILISAVTGCVVTLVIGTARILQLRRAVRRGRS